MRRSLALLIGLLVPAAPAQAATEVVTGLDTSAAGPPAWDKPLVNIRPGDSVRWTFPNTTEFHNVWAQSPNWSDESPLGNPAPDYERVFADVGDYVFICRVHPDTMRGTVHVAVDPPPTAPPPPPPLSAQPFANDAASAVAAETAVTLDRSRPGLASVAAKRVAKGAARVRFEVSEASAVVVEFRRGGRIVRRASAGSVTGTRAITVRGLKAGRYVVRLGATDIAGNRSKPRQVVVRVPLTSRKPPASRSGRRTG